MRAWILPSLFVSLVLALGAGGAAAVEVPLGWTWDQVELRTDEAGETRVKVDGSLLRPGAPGEPSLPARIVRVAAPDGHTVASFSVAGAVTSERILGAPLAPIAEDRPSEAGGPVRVEPLAAAYGAPAFPAERARFLGITLRRGVAYANFAVFPLVVREGRTLELLEQGVLSVEFAPDPTVPLPLKSLRPQGSRSGALPDGKMPGEGPGVARSLSEPGAGITQRPSEASAPVDYVILAPQAFEAAITPFKDWKNQTGTATTIRTLEWVYETYPEGVDSQERIRQFLIEAYRYWGIQWLLIVGGPGEVPIRKAKSYSWAAPTGVDIITDLYYACLDGNWNKDGDATFGEPKRVTDPPNPIGDAVDFDAEIYVGRVPATTSAQVTTWLTKYLTYARTPDLGGYLEKTLLLGEALFATEWTRALLPGCGRAGVTCEVGCDACITRDGADDCLSVIDIMDRGPASRQYVELYEYYEYWQTHGRPDSQLEIKASVVQQMNNGAGIIHHVGHGDKDRLSVGTNGGTDGNGRFLVSDARAMTNGDRVSFAYAINCNSAAIDFDCLGEVMLFAENGGAVTYIGSSNLDFPNSALLYQDAFYTKIFQDLVPTAGAAFYDAIAEIMATQVPDSETYTRFVAYSLLMLGEPQMGIWLKTPSPIVVSAPTTFTLGGSSLAVDVTRNGSALGGATVCAYKANDVYAVGTTNGSGHVVLAFQPTSAGNFQVTVVHPDAVPHMEPANRVVSAPPAAPAVSVIGLPIVDAQGAQTAGNDNGRFEEGETIALGVSLRNGGGAPANDVTLTLTLGPPEIAQYLEVLDGTQTGITVPANTQTYQIAGAFYLKRTDVLVPQNLYQNRDRLPVQATVGLSGGVTGSFTLPLPVYRPLLTLERNAVLEVGGGNANGIPENGETIDWSPLFRNLGAGTASPFRVQATAVGGATIEDGDATLESGEEGDLVGPDLPLRFSVQNAVALAIRLRVESTADPFFVPFDQIVEFVWPTAPIFPTETPPKATPDAIVLQWVGSTAPDLRGHVLERSLQEDTGFAPIHEGVITEMNYFRDEGLPGLTRFYYRAAGVDSSGNRSIFSNVTSATTSPATLPGWPFSVGASMNYGCPTIENINASGPYEIFLTADHLYGMKVDGTEIIDGDGISSTPGIWSPLGSEFWSKPAIADLDGDGDVEIVANSRYQSGTAGFGQLLVWDRSGTLIWQKQLGTIFFASPVIADIDGDDQAEVIAHDRGTLYAWNHDGTPVIQANANGLLAFVGGNPGASPFTFGSPAVADLDGDLKDEVILVLETDRGTNIADKASHVVVVDGDGTILDDVQLEVPANADEQSCNSSPSLADVNGDGIYEIFCSTRSRLWAFNYDSGTRALVPALNWPQSGYVSVQKHPTNWVEPTPAIGDIDGDGNYDVVLGAGLGQVLAVDGRTGATLPGFPRTLGDESSKIGSALLVNLDGDLAAEILVGNNGGTLYGLNADGTDCPGFPYLMGGRIQHGMACWDINRDNHPDLVIQSEQLPEVTTLNISNVFFPDDLSEAMDQFPWCSFRHDARNTGTMSKAVITPVHPLTLTALGQKGEAVLTWDVAAEPASFEVQRQDLSGSWVSLASEPPNFFRATEGGYRYVDHAAPGNYLYRVLGYEADGKPMYESVETAVTILPFALRLVSVAPNPFNPRTAIRYETPGGTLRVEIVDLGGRRVRTLARGEIEPGSHELVWDGRDDAGHDVGSGVYMVRMSAHGGDFSRKIVLLR